MKVKDLVKKACYLEAKALVEDVRLIDEDVPAPSEAYVEILYQLLISKSTFDVNEEKIIITRKEANNECSDIPPVLEDEIREGCWIYASSPELTESVLLLKWCPSKELAEKAITGMNEFGLFSQVDLLYTNEVKC